tara:strand:+ start:519 stop:779 length:261 start_codon:yes stop_codon:yes gene_type:complete
MDDFYKDGSYKERNETFWSYVKRLRELNDYELHTFEEVGDRVLRGNRPVIKHSKKIKKLLDTLMKTRRHYERALDKRRIEIDLMHP